MADILIEILPALEGRGPYTFNTPPKPQVLAVIAILVKEYGHGYLQDSDGKILFGSQDILMKAGVYRFTLFPDPAVNPPSKQPVFSRLEDLLAHLIHTDAFSSSFQQEADCLPLVGRQEDIDWVWSRIRQHAKYLIVRRLSGKDVKRLIGIILIQGGFGTGKTTFIDGLVKQIDARLASCKGESTMPQAGLGISIDFANGDAPTAADARLSPDTFLGVRLIARGALGVSTAAMRRNPLWRSHAHFEKHCTLAAATRILTEHLRSNRHLPRDAWVFLIVCCDEYQCLFDCGLGRHKLPYAANIKRALASWMAVVATEHRVVGQCVLMGLEVSRSGLDITGVGARFYYLRPLQPQEEIAALTEYFTSRGLYSEKEMEDLLGLPVIKTQIAMAFGLPQMLQFLQQALEDDEVRDLLLDDVSNSRRMNHEIAGARIAMLVTESVKQWLVMDEVMKDLGPSVLLHILKLAFSGVTVTYSTKIGNASECMDIATVARLTGIIWSVPRPEETISLRCPPQIMYNLATQLIKQQKKKQSLPPEELQLLHCLRHSINHPFNQALHGEPFQFLTIVAEACRRSILAQRICEVEVDEEGCFALRDLWPGAVASDEVLSERVSVLPIGIARDKAKILAGAAKAPRLVLPGSGLDVIVKGPYDPETWMGEGYAVHMDTAAANTLSADWRLSQMLKGGQLSCNFFQVKFNKDSLPSDDVVERFEALKSAVTRERPDVKFRLVYICSTSFKDDLVEYAKSEKGEGLILIDGQAAAELCPILPRVAYPFQRANAELEQSVLPGELMRRSSQQKPPPSGPVGSMSKTQRYWGAAPRRLIRPRPLRSLLSVRWQPVGFRGSQLSLFRTGA